MDSVYYTRCYHHRGSSVCDNFYRPKMSALNEGFLKTVEEALTLDVFDQIQKRAAKLAEARLRLKPIRCRS